MQSVLSLFTLCLISSATCYRVTLYTSIHPSTSFHLLPFHQHSDCLPGHAAFPTLVSISFYGPPLSQMGPLPSSLHASHIQ